MKDKLQKGYLRQSQIFVILHSAQSVFATICVL